MKNNETDEDRHNRYLKNKEKALTQMKKWQEAHPEYYQEHKEEIKEWNRAYKQRNPEKFKMIKRESNYKYKQKHRWVMNLSNAQQRCNNPKYPCYKSYGGRGIKCLLTLDEIKYLWDRDNAELMEQPVCSRDNHDKNYTLENCHFIEKREHNRIHSGRRLRR